MTTTFTSSDSHSNNVHQDTSTFATSCKDMNKISVIDIDSVVSSHCDKRACPDYNKTSTITMLNGKATESKSGVLVSNDDKKNEPATKAAVSHQTSSLLFKKQNSLDAAYLTTNAGCADSSTACSSQVSYFPISFNYSLHSTPQISSM